MNKAEGGLEKRTHCKPKIHQRITSHRTSEKRALRFCTGLKYLKAEEQRIVLVMTIRHQVPQGHKYFIS
jgi:hypothetical protein